MWLDQGEYECTSDLRVKTNIQTLDPSGALAVVNSLHPVTFNYIHLGRFKTGFIAQEVESLIPETVSFQTQCVPNIYALGTVKQTASNPDTQTYTIVFDQSVNLLPFDGSCNLQLLNHIARPLIVQLISVSSDAQTITVVGNITDTDTYQDQILVYGQQVTDYRSFNPDAVNTYSIAAIQELSKQLTASQTELQETRSALAALQEQMATLISAATVAQLQTTASP